MSFLEGKIVEEPKMLFLEGNEQWKKIKCHFWREMKNQRK